MNALIFADGVFDPLHDQHVAYLRLAEVVDLRCDLVVQVSRQLKRPECLPRDTRARVVAALDCVDRVVEYESTLHALQALRPSYYVKGADWRDRLPSSEREFCAAADIEVRYVDTEDTRSSTALLRAWADLEAQRGVRVFDADAIVQQSVAFDADAQGYTDYGARRAIEAQHPDILAQLCHGKTVLDVGCGPGHLVKMLRERGVRVKGVDPHVDPAVDKDILSAGLADLADTGDTFDVVVCREVLEHIPVREWGLFLARLFQVARERVYLTTRFTQAPAHPFELTDELDVDPSHITKLPLPFVRALCVVQGGHRDPVWEQALDWLGKGRVLVYEVRR